MHKKPTRIILLTFDIAAMILAFILSGLISKYLSHNMFGNPEMDISSGEVVKRISHFTLMCTAALFMFYNRGHYSRRIPWWSQVRYIMIVLISMLLIEVFVHFTIKHQISRLWMVSSWLSIFFFIIIARQAARKLSDTMGIWKVPTIIIGDKNNIIETIFALYSEKYTGYDVNTIIINKGHEDFDREALPIPYQNIEVINGQKSYHKIIAQNQESFFILAPDSFNHFNAKEIIDEIHTQNSDYAVVPPIEGVDLYGSSPQFFFGHNIIFLLSRKNIHSPLGKFVKRALDITGALCGIIALSPIFAAIALFVKKDGGPAFFGHTRIGKNDKKFKCWKFRTMQVDAEERLKDLLDKDPEARKIWDTHRKLPNDPRVTKIGDFLRKSSIDEFPQLFNVLKGEMSLVGPRPILPDEVIFFDKTEIENYKSVKPGVTGLWQVSGRNDVSFKQRVNFDSWYIQNWSFWSDVVIIVKTVFVVICRVGIR